MIGGCVRPGVVGGGDGAGRGDVGINGTQINGGSELRARLGGAGVNGMGYRHTKRGIW